MTTTNITTANQRKIELAEAALNELLAESLQRGFFGTFWLELAVQDGTIQHVRRSIERIEK